MLSKFLQPPAKRWQVLLFFGMVTFALYWPVLGNGFLTDDYAALYRICVKKQVFHGGFFRLLIDITFYSNYLISGLHPWSYYVFNMAVHVCTCYMMYKVALELPFFRDERQKAFAWMASVLFLFYPFHSESIVWLSGRLSSISTLCALTAVYYVLRAPDSRVNLSLAGVMMLIGLLAYESIIVLPAMIIILTWRKDWGRARTVRALGFWAGVLLLYIAARLIFSQLVVVQYFKVVHGSDGTGNYFVRGLKSFGRCLLPPVESPWGMTAAFVVVFAGVAVLHFLLWKKRRQPGLFFSTYVRTGFVFLLSMLPVVFFGISTRTSEGDRLLYFPSCWVCIMASACIYLLVEKREWLLAAAGVLACSGAVFIAAGNRHWVQASEASSTILSEIKSRDRGKILLVNLPDEVEGGMVFRNNVRAWFVINGVDSNRVMVSNKLTRLEYLKVQGDIQLEKKGDSISIWPCTMIRTDSVQAVIYNMCSDSMWRLSRADDVIYYWDKSRWKGLILNERDH